MYSLETIIALNARKQAEYDAKHGAPKETPAEKNNPNDIPYPLTDGDKALLKALGVSYSE